MQQKDVSITACNHKTFNLYLQQMNLNNDEMCKIVKRKAATEKQLRSKLE
jgi:hypothetical protein